MSNNFVGFCFSSSLICSANLGHFRLFFSSTPAAVAIAAAAAAAAAAACCCCCSFSSSFSSSLPLHCLQSMSNVE